VDTGTTLAGVASTLSPAISVADKTK